MLNILGILLQKHLVAEFMLRSEIRDSKISSIRCFFLDFGMLMLVNTISPDILTFQI